MDWFERDFDHPAYFEIYASKAREAGQEGPALARYLALPSRSCVFDLPCGWGRLHPHFLDMGWLLIGGDLSPSNLSRHAREHPARLVRLDFRRLPFRNAVADGVMCAFTSWGYFQEEEENLQQLREFARILRPGGVLLLDLAGRHFLEHAAALLEGTWYDVEDGQYRERVRWTPDRRRILTDRIKDGERFRHDIWIPRDSEVRSSLAAAGFGLEHRWGGLEDEPWHREAERWIYRALKV